MTQGAVQLSVIIDNINISIEKEHLSSLQVTRNLGDTANKFTLEVFDETAYQIENALAGKGQPGITVKYAAANNWGNNKFSSVVFTGVCIDYQLSFVGRATMLSLEGVLSAARTDDGTTAWWFKKATINWCNADLEYDDNGNEEIDGHSPEDALAKSLGNTGFNINDPKDIVCAYANTTDVDWVDPMTGDTILSNTTDVYVNPARIFRRIMAAYNQAFPGCFPVAEIEECRWIKGIDTIQQNETAPEYINRVLCKNAVTYTNNGSSDFKDQVAGFQYYVDGQGHHFKRLDYMDSNDTNTISLHFGHRDSRVISFSAANIGALAMAGVGKASSEQLLASISSLDTIYSDLITIEGENFAGYTASTTVDDTSDNSNYFVNMLASDKLALANNIATSDGESLSAEYTTAYTNLSQLPFEAQLTVWGEYSNEIKPGKFINLLTYDKNGQSHYTTGVYYIVEVLDDISAEGYIQTATMIKNMASLTSGAIDADDSTGSTNDSYTENSGVVSYTMSQKPKDSVSTVNKDDLATTRVKNARSNFGLTTSTKPIDTRINPY